MGGSLDRFFSFKILRDSDRLQAAAQADDGVSPLPYPVDWHVYPSNFCNHSCPWCVFRQPDPTEQAKIPGWEKLSVKQQARHAEQFLNRSQLSRDLMIRAVAAASRTGARLMHFSGGGEPLINKHTLEAMTKAGKAGIKVALSTNGEFLTPEVAAVTDYLRVSLNAGTKDQHDWSNHAEGGSSWDRIMQALETSLPHRKQDVGLAYVIDLTNVDDIVPFCSLAVQLGVDFVHIRPAFYYDKDKDAAQRAQMKNAFKECEKARKWYGDKVQIFALTEKFDGFWTPRQYDKCRAILTGTTLTATGEFAVCQDRPDLRFGADWKDGETFEEVWQSDEHRQLTSRICSPGELDRCPRCVWNTRNDIIEKIFVNDDVRLDLV